MDERSYEREMVLGVADWNKEKILKAYKLKSEQLGIALAEEAKANVTLVLIHWEALNGVKSDSDFRDWVIRLYEGRINEKDPTTR